MQFLLLVGEFATALIFLPILLIYLWAFEFWDWITGETAREYRRQEAEWNAQQAEKAAREAARAEYAARAAEQDAHWQGERAEWVGRTGETSEQAWVLEMLRRLGTELSDRSAAPL
jgi:hypothetical protein